jgi:hypothetical protein
LNSDEILKTMVAEAVKQQTQIRSAVCDIMLKALQARELGLSQINNVVRNVTKGVNAGLGDKGDVEKVLADAVAGMDDALLKVVEANQVALTKLTEGSWCPYKSSLETCTVSTPFTSSLPSSLPWRGIGRRSRERR